jgi:hypothetical protein
VLAKALRLVVVCELDFELAFTCFGCGCCILILKSVRHVDPGWGMGFGCNDDFDNHDFIGSVGSCFSISSGYDYVVLRLDTYLVAS